MQRTLRWTAIAGCLLALGGASPSAPPGGFAIAVVSSRDIAPYRAARQGFVAALDAAGVAYHLDEFGTEPDAAGSDLIERLRARHPDLILTIGSAATEAVGRRIHDTPIVYSLVLQTGNGGPDEVTELGDNVTGASMSIPLRVQFEKLRQAIPGARRFGVMYNPDETGRTVDEAARVAESLGLELVPVPVRTEADVVERLEDLETRIDLLWSVADSTVFTPRSVQHILLNTLRHKIPFIGLSPSYVRAGALLSLSCDYVDVGRQSGELALRILGGAAPRDVPMTTPRSVSFYLNVNTARQLEITISEAVRDSAELVSGS